MRLLELEELYTDKMIIYKHVFKQKHRLSDTFCVGRSTFLFFFYCAYYRPEKQVSMIRKYRNHTLQTKTRPDIIIHFIKQRDQFHFDRKLYVQKCVPV